MPVIHIQYNVRTFRIDFVPDLQQFPDPCQRILTLQQGPCSVIFQPLVDHFRRHAQIYHCSTLMQQGPVHRIDRSASSHRQDTFVFLFPAFSQQFRLQFPEIGFTVIRKDLCDAPALLSLDQLVRVFYRHP